MDKFHQKTLGMIILQCFIMIICRMPEMVLTVYKIKLQMLKTKYDILSIALEIYYSSILPELQSIFLIFTNFGFMLNILIVFLFNQKLKTAFLHLIRFRKFKIFQKMNNL